MTGEGTATGPEAGGAAGSRFDRPGRSAKTAGAREREVRLDWWGAACLAFLGVGCRVAFTLRFPTEPFSDFNALVRFALQFRDHGLFVPGWHWVQFNPGLPLVLSLLYRLFPDPAATAIVARTATAIATGLLPLIPFFLWRGVFAYRWRLLAGLLLGLWPGQVFFSGVVAQENWVLLPSVALACLTVRTLRDPRDEGHPIAAGLLLAVAVVIRQEMLVVLLPVAIAGAGLTRRRSLRGALLLLGAAGLPLLAFAAQRAAASGRFAITTEHGGLGLLGSMVPGSGAGGWVDPTVYVASVNPALVKDLKAMREASYGLAWREFKRRYRFHVFRMAVAALRLSVESDAEDLYWSIGAPEALPQDLRARGERWAARWAPRMRVELALIQGLFVAAVLVGIWRRDAAILVLLSAVLLKFAIQALVSAMGRLMVPAIALELLVVAVAASHLADLTRRERIGAGALGAVVAGALLGLTPPLERLVARKDEQPPLVRHFPLAIVGGGWIDCEMRSGQLVGLEFNRARIGLRRADPLPGETARAVCRVPSGSAGESLRLRIEDPYERGGMPDRIVERVEIDGREAFRHDVAREPGAGWFEVDLPRAPGGSLEVAVELIAVRPDAGWKWGRAVSEAFELVRSQAPGRPTH
jgi:hypothetical protein